MRRLEDTIDHVLSVSGGTAIAIDRWRKSSFLQCLGCALLVTSAAQSAQYIVTDLGVPGAENTLGWGINASGQVTGYAGTAGEDNINGFVWNPTMSNSSTGTLHRLETLGGYFSWGIGINAGGQIAGLSATTDDEAEHATLWNPTSPNGSTGSLHDLGTLGGTYSQGTGINDYGQLTGYADLTDNEESHAVMWKPNTPGSASGTMHDLQTLGGTLSFGWDINAAGQVTGDSTTTDDVATHAMLWQPASPNGSVGMMHDLLTLGGTTSTGAGINDHGLVAGYSQTTDDGGNHAFLWTPWTPAGVVGDMLDLETLGGVDSYGLAVSNSGLVVGSSAVSPEISNYYHAFIYSSETGMVDLNTLIDPHTDWELLDAHDINDAGQITGQGRINEEYHAFLLTPIPNPGDFNHDGTVDAADYVVWRKGLGTTYTQDHYNIWRAHFGMTAGSSSGSAGASPSQAFVPEPATLLLLILAAAGWCLRRGRATSRVQATH
jgi:probable HAF family extracellular repeat protein